MRFPLLALSLLLLFCGQPTAPSLRTTARITSLTVTPPTASVPVGGTKTFVATATWSDGAVHNLAVVWTATGGTITVGGVYTAGSVAGSYRVVARHYGGTLADTSAVTITGALATTLRAAAQARGFLIGTEIDLRFYPLDPRYGKLIADQFNLVVPDNVLKFSSLHYDPAGYDFGQADQFMAIALANGQAVHGHTLVWNQSLPTWVSNGTWTKATLLAVLKDHITTVVSRYKGRIQSWDVVNEVVYADGKLGDNPTWIWQRIIGPEFIDSAFVWANRADPQAKLYLNGAGIEQWNIRSDTTLALAKRLKARGVPIHGVGFESHFIAPGQGRSNAYPDDVMPPAADLQANFARYAAAGFLVRVSELDVKLADTAGVQALDAEATVYRDVLDACLRLGAMCGGVTMWGSTDAESWIPQWYPGFGRALPFDVNYQPKPAYQALLTRLQQP